MTSKSLGVGGAARLFGIAATGCVLAACFGSGSAGPGDGGGFDSAAPEFDAGHPDASTPDAALEAESGADAAGDGPAVDSTTSDAATDGAAADGAQGQDAVADAGSTCDPLAAPDPLTGVFVSASGGDDATGDGSIASPFATIGKGITRAAASGTPNVYVAPGTYTESLDIPPSAAGIFVQGGWSVAAGNTWSTDCVAGAPGRTVVQGGPTAVTAIGIPVASGLSSLTIETPADVSTASPGESLIGVLVSGSNVSFSLVDVHVVAGNAGNGAVAAPTTPATDTVCGACTNTVTNGTTPPAGTTASAPGTFTAGGFTPADGQDGQGGGAGTTGTPPPAPETISYTSDCAGSCFAPCTDVTSQLTGYSGG
ncbi:MAG: hypothetical protein ACRELB_01845, partial [Polyangiaceae bacterium]